MSAPILEEKIVEPRPVLPSPDSINSHYLLMWLAPLLLFAIPSLLLLLGPPIFSLRESATLLCEPISFLVPHWQPLYPEFLFLTLSFMGKTAIGFRTVLLLQHLLAVAASLYLVTAFPGVWQRMVSAVFCLAAAQLLVPNHGIFPEAISLSFLLVYIGALTRVALSPTASLDACFFSIDVETAPEKHLCTFELKLTPRKCNYVVSFLSLLLISLTSFNMVALGILGPLFFLLTFLLERKTHSLTALAHFCLINVLVLVLSIFGQEIFCKVFGTEFELHYGRAAVERLHKLDWVGIKASEREHILNNVRRKCIDDVGRVAVPLLSHSKLSSRSVYEQVNGFIPVMKSAKSVDRVLNETATAFFSTPNKYLLSDSFNSFVSLMGDGHVLQSLIFRAVNSCSLYNSGEVQPELHCLLQQSDLKAASHATLWSILRFFDSICNYFALSFLAIFISILGRFKYGTSPKEVALALTLVLTATAYAAGLSFFTVPSCQELSSVNVLVWLALAVSVLSLRSKSCIPPATGFKPGKA